MQAPESGIYEVEHTILSHLGEKECSCIIFHDGKTKWTVKLTGYVNDFKLTLVSDALNEEELRLKKDQGVTDERLLTAKWGGGDTIIGAPRYHNGSAPFIPKNRITEIVLESLNKQLA